ncbi:hypothetical protein CXG81DRAFT_13715 [Caulochytrium protostelioides]|uniref:Polyadenylation factor subunit 2 n=1 Tax=Caulochytrium protostelioides TaxID=1555241 RepID=A0A4P9X4L8_9FUNG|nr:hypothetical protein CXG81DRAFT_13715 [Caulochytrium protostelioides]|eukprot:RKP00028.1 hypothetical protein CXG81DRAFT_13715 [Caulochytrium protostelioides]
MDKVKKRNAQRRTLDPNSGIIRYLGIRRYTRDVRDLGLVLPDPSFVINMLPPGASVDNIATAVCTRYVHTSTNKSKCTIHAARWTPDGRRLLTGAATGEFTLWNGLTFNFESIMQAHDGPIRAMRWSHNDVWLLSGDDTGTVKYWQSNMNNLKMVQAHREPIMDIAFSPNDSRFATASDDSTIKIWGFADSNEERTLTGHGWDVKCLDWHPTKGLLASGSKDNLVKLWDPKTGAVLSTLHGHHSTVTGITWNRNGHWLATSSRDQMVRVFDVRTLKEMASFRGSKEISCVAWHPVHEALFSSGGADGSLMFWDVHAPTALGGVEKAHDTNIATMDWHPLGHVLATGSNDHATRFWGRNRPGEGLVQRIPSRFQGMDDGYFGDGMAAAATAAAAAAPVAAARRSAAGAAGAGTGAITVTPSSTILPPPGP